MARLTLGDVKDSDIPSVVNYIPSDPRFARIVGEAEQRLMELGKWWGCYGRFKLCVDKDCITWPRQFAAIEAISFCGVPLQIRSEFFEFLESGAGVRDDEDCSNGNHCCRGNGCGCGSLNMLDRGTVCSFAEICGTNKKIKVYADVAESADAQILLQGYDENNNFIRTEVDGEWIDGEYVDIKTATATSTHFFSVLTGVQKPVTNGTVRLYELNMDDATQRAIAIYEPDETRPQYRRSFVGGIRRSDSDGDCEFRAVTVMAKLEHMLARKDTDWLTIQSRPALKLACQAIRKEGNNLMEDAQGYWLQAMFVLNKQLRHYLGSGIIQPIRMQPRSVGGAGVLNLI